MQGNQWCDAVVDSLCACVCVHLRITVYSSVGNSSLSLSQN